MLSLTRALALLAFASLLPAQAPKMRPAPSNAPAKLRQLNPKQRKMLLESLPPDRRKQAADRLDRLESLSPEEREQLDRRWRQFSQMSQEDREKARGVFRDLNSLPDHRREALRPELEKLHSLAPSDRSAYLKGDDLKKRFSKNELRILNRYSDIAAAPQL